jgi:hypothetical protein
MVQQRLSHHATALRWAAELHGRLVRATASGEDRRRLERRRRERDIAVCVARHAGVGAEELVEAVARGDADAPELRAAWDAAGPRPPSRVSREPQKGPA